MATAKIPVVVWQDYQGFYTALPAEPGLVPEGAAGFHTSSGAALQQLRSYLTWQCKQFDGWLENDFRDPELLQVRVNVRPQYQDPNGRRSYPCPQAVDLRIPCVRGRTEGGILRCVLPTMSLGFTYYEAAMLRRMVAEMVRHELGEDTPQQLSRLLPPNSIVLDQIQVKLPRQRRQSDRGPHIPTLNRVAEPIAAPGYYRNLSPAHERETELADLVGRLRDETGPVLLLGEAGVGKSTLLVAAARAAERKSNENQPSDGPADDRPRRYWQTSAARLIAGMRYLGEWQERCEELISELAAINGVLCADRLIDFLHLGGEGPDDSIAAFLLPYLQSGELRLIGEATPAEWEACRRLMPSLVGVFQVFRVDELKRKRARAALTQIATVRARNEHITIEQPVIDSIFRLFRRFQPYRPLPGRAARFLDELFDRVKQEKGVKQDKGPNQNQAAKQDQDAAITPLHVADRFIQETGLPELFLHDDQPLDAAEVENRFRQDIIGQDAACRAVAGLVSTFKAGLNDPQRPIGSLLFCGPTGVGKTQLAKTLSQYLFGHGDASDRLVRLDMSEYSHPYAAERLIMKDDGTPSEFVTRVRKQPFTVVLLDEIEKASPEVFDVMLGLLDEGRLTDRYGRTTDFRTAIVIMTSNLGASSGRSIGFADESPDTFAAEVRAFFRPEFFNRLDNVVTFHPLSRETCLAITRKELDEIARREGLANRQLRLTYSDDLVTRLADEGFDPRYGARPLQRTLEQRVVAALSRHLVEHPTLRDKAIQAELDDAGNCQIRLL